MFPVLVGAVPARSLAQYPPLHTVNESSTPSVISYRFTDAPPSCAPRLQRCCLQQCLCNYKHAAPPSPRVQCCSRSSHEAPLMGKQLSYGSLVNQSYSTLANLFRSLCRKLTAQTDRSPELAPPPVSALPRLVPVCATHSAACKTPAANPITATPHRHDSDYPVGTS